MSKRPEAIEFLEKHQDKIDWAYLGENPAIFVDSVEYEI